MSNNVEIYYVDERTARNLSVFYSAAGWFYTLLSNSDIRSQPFGPFRSELSAKIASQGHYQKRYT